MVHFVPGPATPWRNNCYSGGYVLIPEYQKCLDTKAQHWALGTLLCCSIMPMLVTVYYHSWIIFDDTWID